MSAAQRTSDPGAIETRRIDPVSADQAEEAPRGANHEPISILIVDDEPGNLMVLETVLDDPGYRLVRAQSADQALLALVQEEFALLILDIRMPGMTGFELAQMIKERKRTAGVPIIFLTAYYDKDQHVLEGYGSGAVDFLNKPVNSTVLRSKVAVFADLHRKNRAITLANAALVAEVGERRRAEDQLRDLNRTLERRVIERTESLRQIDQQLRDMMASITDGLVTLDLAWRFTYANEQGARLLGMDANRLLGACVWELFPHTRGSTTYLAYHRAVESGKTESFEEFYPEPVGRWFQFRCYPSPAGLSVYFLDVTDRREVDVRREQLLAAEQAARAEGERVARAKDEFLTLLSHELRTPLAAIVGWSKILQRTTTDIQTWRRGIEVIARNAQAQAQLVSDLLDVGRIVSGKLRMSVERVDLNAIAATAADTVRPMAQAANVTVETRLADEASTLVMGDSSRLHQIASNLVNNALKFTPAGGVVTISTAVTDSHIELHVTDTGEGIAAEFLPHLFDRFTQADGSAARVHGGLGLGLSIVKSLVELHAGSVTAHSAGRGQGASFKVQLPRFAEVGQPVSALPLPLQPPPGGQSDALVESVMDAADTDDADLSGLSVLLVDDHADVLEVVRRMLCESGAHVTTADSSEQALQFLRAERFDVLLSDLGMPGLDGYSLIQLVRTDLGLSAAQLPAAAVTAFVRTEDRLQAIRSGYQAVIQKPASQPSLVRAVFCLARDRGTCAAAAPANTEVQQGPGPDNEQGSDSRGLTGSSASHARLRTLFVEDNVDLQEQIGWLLEEEGLDLVTCATAEAAIAEFTKGGFDVVVTDVSLPKMTGVELARRVLKQSPSMWVVFSTGYEMGDRLGTLGPNVRTLLKPFEADALHEVMNEVRLHLRRDKVDQ